jgi:hypothetical protein
LFAIGARSTGPWRLLWPLTKGKFHPGVLGFLSGLTVDNLGQLKGSGISVSIERAASAIDSIARTGALAIHAGPELTNGLQVSLWMTFSTVVATSLVGAVVATV